MLIQTSQLGPLDETLSHQVYCGLDCLVMSECFEELSRTFNREPGIYAFERALQGPYLDIMLRGFKVNQEARQEAAQALHRRIEFLSQRLNTLALAVWDKPLIKPGKKLPHYTVLQDFFYGSMKLPEVWISQKGQKKLSSNREALEKLEQYLYARPFVSLILGLRELYKQLEVFETQIDPDGRYRTSYNIAGTETGRPSSSQNPFGTGSNMQNISSSLRYIFTADPGWKLCVIDLEQVEARDVGFFIGCLFDDWDFLDACESGDLHTNNAKRIWPELPWTGDHREDRKIADRNFYREFSYRDMAKRGSHLCLTEDHEVLTPEGWINISYKPPVIMSWNEKTGSQFEQVNNWTDEEYEGDLHCFEGNSVSLKMTANHRVPYKTDQRNAGDIKFAPACFGPQRHIPLGSGWIGGALEVPARLIAAFMSDGHQASTNRVHFHMKKEHKFDRLEFLCNEYGFRYERRGDLGVIEASDWPKACGAYMFTWTKECIESFIDEYKFWDGHISETAVRIFSVKRDHLEWIQTFGRICGIGGNIRHSVTRTNFSNRSKEYLTDYYILQQNNRKWATGKSISWTKFKKSERVFCPTVKNQMFYVRRAGKICITGNSNYMGTAWTASRNLKVPQQIMEDFQARYCRGRPPQKGLPAIAPAFPGIPRYWQWCAEQLQTVGLLETPFGRRRHFFGRPDDDATLREAIAFMPQSTTADRMNLGLWRVWKKMPQVQLLAQTYDSITFQYPEELDETELLNEALQLIRVELRSPSGRSYVVPGEAKIGWNWQSQITEEDIQKARQRGDKRLPKLNLQGLKKLQPLNSV